MRGLRCLALVLSLIPVSASAQKGLDIYFVDVEGGAATLIVTPIGESVLIDCGSPGDRDADRIASAARAAGLKRIDHLVATHWHSDHFGGTADLAKRIPIERVYHRGITPKGDEGANYDRMIADFKRASANRQAVLRAGDWLPLNAPSGSLPVNVLTVCGSKKFIPDPPGAAPNPFAEKFLPKDPDPSDNAESLGFVLSFGGFRFLDLGDLTWNMEQNLVAPTNKIGLIDVYLTTHHGLDQSNNSVLIQTVSPRVAVFNNGPHKGGHPDVTKALRSVPGIQAIFQLHKNLGASEAENTSAARIANTTESAQCDGKLIKLSVAADGNSYTVQVGENGQKERFATRSVKR